MYMYDNDKKCNGVLILKMCIGLQGKWNLQGRLQRKRFCKSFESMSPETPYTEACSLSVLDATGAAVC